MAKTHLKVKLACEDVGRCRDYYEVTEGKNEGLIICHLEHDGWHTVSDSDIDGEPWYPIDLERFNIEVV